MSFRDSIALITLYVLFNCPLALDLGVSGTIVYCIAVFFIVLYFVSGSVLVITKEERSVIWVIFLIQFIDKLNDCLGGGGVGQLLQVVFTVLFLLFLISAKDRKQLQPTIRRALFCGAFFLIVYAIVCNIPLKELDRDASIMLLFWFAFYVFDNKRYKIPIGLLVFYILWFVLEARAASGAMVFFLALYYLNIKKTSKKNLLLCLCVVGCFGLIAAAVLVEYQYMVQTPIFTGRGVIWGEALDSFNGCPDRNLVFGFPSTEAQLDESFSDFHIEGYGKHLGEILLRGNFHNGYIYTLYNCGILGIVLLLYLIFVSPIAKKENTCNFILLCTYLVVFSLQGRAIGGVYAPSLIFMIINVVPVINKKYEYYKTN